MAFLSSLEEYLPAAISDMKVDYIDLSRTYNMLMKLVRVATHSNLDVTLISSHHPGDSVDLGNLPMIVEILDDNFCTSKIQEAVMKDRGTFKSKSLLEVAREVLKQMRAKKETRCNVLVIQHESFPFPPIFSSACVHDPSLSSLFSHGHKRVSLSLSLSFLLLPFISLYTSAHIYVLVTSPKLTS